jgi:hypothetical protein
MENGPFELSPERGRFALLYSYLEDKTVYFSTSLAKFSMPDLGYKNNHFVSLFAPAVSFIGMPGYLIGKAFGASQVGAFATAAIFALINILLIRTIAVKLGAHHITALIAMVIFIFASPAYAYGVSLYQHHISTFLILMSVYLYLSSTSLLATAAIWALCAAAIPIDYPNLFLLFPIGLATLIRLFPISLEKGIVRMHAKLLAPLTFIAMILPLGFFLWFNTISYGNALQFSGTIPSAKNSDFVETIKPNLETQIETSTTSALTTRNQKNAVSFFTSRGLLNGLYILLLSPDRGVLYFTPVVLLGLFGIAFLTRKNSPYATIFGAIITTNIIFYAMYGDVWGGWAFGSRYLIPSYALLSIGLAIALTKWRKNIFLLIVFLIFAGYCVGVNAAGALSSSANPPQVQVLQLEKLSGREEKYTAMRNVDQLKTRSKSFVYQTWLHTSITSWQFYQIIVGAIMTIIIMLTIGLFIQRNRGRYDLI